MTNSKPDIIIDYGSRSIKAGFGGQEGPISVFPSIVGRPKYKKADKNLEIPNYYVGSNAYDKRSILSISYPINEGIIVDWESMENLLEHTFTVKLGVNYYNHNVMLTEPPFTYLYDREKIASMMFDSFSVPGLLLMSQAVLSLFSTGKCTGFVCDSGDDVTNFVPIYEGCSLPHSSLKIKLAGRDLTQYMARILSDQKYTFYSERELEILKDIKEKTCYVALNYADELSISESEKGKVQEYEMPDRAIIKIRSQAFRCTEVLFDPSIIGLKTHGIHRQIHESIMKTDVDLRRKLCENIVLSGGNTLFHGLPERLLNETKNLCNKNMGTWVKVHAEPEKKYSVWVGGSIFSSNVMTDSMWITKDEFDDAGVSIVHRKRF